MELRSDVHDRLIQKGSIDVEADHGPDAWHKLVESRNQTRPIIPHKSACNHHLMSSLQLSDPTDPGNDGRQKRRENYRH